MMRLRRRGIGVIVFLMLTVPVLILHAQGDGLNLPAALYVLLNEGRVERYGLGAMGVSIVTPQDAYVIDFGVASDGHWIAYRTQDGLSVLAMSGEAGDPVLLDTSANFPPIRQGGQTLIWSPGGDALAYTTEYGARVALDIRREGTRFTDIVASPLVNLLWSPDGNFLAAEAQNDIWWIYRRNFDTFSLVGALPSSVGVTWADGARLIFAPAEGGLILLDLADANAQTELQAPTRRYYHPYLRGDGTLAVFSRALTDTETIENSAYFEQLRFDGQTLSPIETSLTPTDLSGVQWAPRGELAIAFRSGVLVLIQPQIGQSIVLPVANAVGFGWGSTAMQSVSGFDTGRDAFFRAPDTFGVLQVWRLPGDGSPASPITDSELDVTTYAIANDGDTLAFVADGSLSTLDLTTADSAPVEITRVSHSATDLTFNIDDSALIYAVTARVDGGLWQVESTLTPNEAGETQLNVSRQIVANEDGSQALQPQAAPNVNALLIQVAGDRREFAIFDPDSEVLLMIGAYDYAHWMRDGRVVAWINTPSGAQVTVINPAADPVIALPLIDLPDAWVLDVAQVDDASFRIVTGAVDPLRPSMIRVNTLPVIGGALGLLVEFPALTAPLLSPDGEWVIGGAGYNGMVGIGGTGQMLDQAPDARDLRWGRP